MVQQLGEPAHFVLFMHTAQAHRAFVEWRKAQRVGLTTSDHLRAQTQAVEDEAAVVGARPCWREASLTPGPVHDVQVGAAPRHWNASGFGAQFQCLAAGYEEDFGLAGGCGVIQQTGDDFRANTGRVANR